MTADRLFEDDDLLFPPANDADDEDDARASHVELKIDATTIPELRGAPCWLARVPQLAVSPRELPLLPLGHVEAFLLSRIDGAMTIESILDVCAMPEEEALAILDALVARGVVVVP